MTDGIGEEGLVVWPAAERNKEPILRELARRLPGEGRLLEVASGTGQHAAFFVTHLEGWTIQPTDADPGHLRTIEHRRTLAGLGASWSARFLEPRALDVTEEWPALGPFDAIFCANMIHIAPFEACLGLFRGAATAVRAEAPLFLYGPFRMDGRHHAESNAAFDESLRRKDPRFGVRDLEEVRRVAETFGFSFSELVGMPANNHLVVFRSQKRALGDSVSDK